MRYERILLAGVLLTDLIAGRERTSLILPTSLVVRGSA